MRNKTTAVIWCLLLLGGSVIAQDSLVFRPKPGQPVQSFIHQLQFLEDKERTLGIEDLLQTGQHAFRPYDAVKYISPYSTWWVKLELIPSFSSSDFCIGLPQSGGSGISQGNDKADVWIVAGEHILANYETGTLTPLSKRPLKRPINHNLFPVRLIQDEKLVIYWRLERTKNFYLFQLDYALQHSSVIDSGASSSDRLAWFYTGVMFILFMFGLIFMVITRERPFTWFMCMAANLCLHMQLLEPRNNLTLFLFPERPVFQFHLFILLIMSFGVLILQFIRSFVHTRLLLPKWDKMIVVMMLYGVVIALLRLIFLETAATNDVPAFFFLIAFVATMAIAVRLIFTRNLYARWSGVALLWLYVFQFLGIFWNTGSLPEWVPNPWATSQIGMMIILFFALAYRFRQSVKEKAEAAKVLEMDAIKSRFFANISHEFRTPLTLMLGPLKQMETGSLDEAQRKKYNSVMRRNGDRLLQLINQLLDLSKLESGKMALQIAKTDLTAFLKSIASSFDSLAEQNQVNYHVHFPEENIIGFVDRDKLEKIMVNLVSNAFRFTAPNGTVSFSVDYDGKRLRFTVQDNGVGMPKEQLDKIFDRFHQVAGTEGGTGIGLSLAKELLQLHKGQISVQSETGKGSIFRVSVPVAAEFYDPSEITGTPASTQLSIVRGNEVAETVEESEPSFTDTSQPLVLIVEDNRDLQQFISDTLSAHFRVEVAVNGQLGLEKALQSIPDCIVSDVMMPVMDGVTFCERLKKDVATSHVPVILLTAKAGSSSRIEGLKTGADDYLVKPFDGAELIARIQNLIEQRKQLRERYSKQVISVQPDELSVSSTEQAFIGQVRGVIDENLDNEMFGVAELANAIHLSRSQLHRKLKSLTGFAPNELIRNYRLERALQLLEQHSGTVTEIAYQTGFSSPAYFSKCFSDRYGYSPGEVKKRI